MSHLILLAFAVGLAMDAMAVSAARGVVSRRKREATQLAVVFGIFQAGMPALGWMLGAFLGPHVGRWTSWIAAALLAGIGVKMLWDGRPGADAPDTPTRPLGPGLLLLLGVATSIDAFAAGISMPVLDLPLLASAVTVGVVTSVLSLVGFSVALRVGERFGARVARFGGAVLLLLAAKAFYTGGAGSYWM